MPKLSVLAREPRDLTDTGATEARILSSAITLFAERGFDQVTVRDIAVHAAANPAAICYYFGAKEQLIKEAIRAVIAPLNDKRLAALAALQQDDAPIRVEDVVAAMVVPTVQAWASDKGPERHYARVLVLAFALRQPFVDEVMSEQTDEVAARFVDALMLALPGSRREEMYWRFDFMIGALLHILLDSSRNYRLKRVSGGLCDTADAKSIISQLITFLTAGLQAKRPSKARQQK